MSAALVLWNHAEIVVEFWKALFNFFGNMLWYVKKS